ncbi:DUF3768 domain-containing protein [Endozoicomonas sp. SESOKO1]|uniref:DUF3768 domain-containing protein n=1 Tax=Endozoicomonas sp. SESOKO1 TaxID=2828742 RepID=UPI00214997C4|nr:DUF3768 domain-containing protein [Endozoicomonas sp. SESOKO1]
MKKIALYNDRVRRSLIDYKEEISLLRENCRFKVMRTRSVAHTIKDKNGLLAAIANFNAFNEDNDPYGEHDFIIIEFEGHKVFAKFGYYAPDLEHGSEDPENLSKTFRVLTIMLASDY